MAVGLTVSWGPNVVGTVVVFPEKFLFAKWKRNTFWHFASNKETIFRNLVFHETAFFGNLNEMK